MGLHEPARKQCCGSNPTRLPGSDTVRLTCSSRKGSSKVSIHSLLETDPRRELVVNMYITQDHEGTAWTMATSIASFLWM